MPKRDKTSTHAPSPPGDTVTIEADSVEEAMERLAVEVGELAQIVDARKIQRGGIGGFFARERVQLTARAGATPPPAASGAQPAAGGLAGALDRMTRDAEAQETDFAAMLRRELGPANRDLGLDTFLEAVGWDQRTSAAEAAKAHDAVDEITAAMTRPAPAPPAAPEHTAPPTIAPPPPVTGPPITPEPAGGVRPEPPVAVAVPAAASPETAADWRETPLPIAPPGMGPVAWSTMELVRHGIPTEIVSAVADLDADDDFGWISGLAAAVAPYCGEITADQVLLGPTAPSLAAALELPVIEPGQTAPYGGSFATYVATPEDEGWLEFVRGGRVLHHVIGGDHGRQELFDVPAAISWVDRHSLVDALYLAVACHAQLGYGPLSGDGSVVRANPVDVALALRAMMERR